MTKENALAGQRGMFFVMLAMILMIWGMAFSFHSPLPLFEGGEVVGKTEVNPDAYVIQMLVVCSLLICIPLGLKWMTLGFVRKKIVAEPQGVYMGYFTQYVHRLSLLSTPWVFSVCNYILAPQTTPILCTAIVVIALLFCYPSRERMDYELSFIEGEVDEDGKIKK